MPNVRLLHLEDSWQTNLKSIKRVWASCFTNPDFFFFLIGKCIFLNIHWKQFTCSCFFLGTKNLREAWSLEEYSGKVWGNFAWWSQHCSELCGAHAFLTNWGASKGCLDGAHSRVCGLRKHNGEAFSLEPTARVHWWDKNWATQNVWNASNPVSPAFATSQAHLEAFDDVAELLLRNSHSNSGNRIGCPPEPALLYNSQRSLHSRTVFPHQRGPRSCQFPHIFPSDSLHPSRRNSGPTGSWCTALHNVPVCRKQCCCKPHSREHLFLPSKLFLFCLVFSVKLGISLVFCSSCSVLFGKDVF